MRRSIELQPQNNLDELSESFNLRLSKRDLALLEKISDARGCSGSDFIRLTLRREFAKLGFLSEEERKALAE